MNLVTESSTAYLLLCVAVGLAYAGVLYFRTNHFDEIKVWLKWLMAMSRFVLVTLLCFLLMKPLLTTIFREVEKPLVLLATDNSESILIGNDSSFYKDKFAGEMRGLRDRLSDDYEVLSFSFGERLNEGLSFSYADKQTDISQLLEELYHRFSNRNIGAVIVASDGIVNKGRNPVYSDRVLPAPLYTIGLGDTAVKKDLLINSVAHNRLAYLGNKFPLEIVVDAKKYNGSNTQLTVKKGAEVLFSQEINIKGAIFTQTIPVLIEAAETGVAKYDVQLTSLAGEVSLENNKESVFIDVLDGRQKILILAASPHPDVAALKSVIEKNENYEVETKLAANFSEDPGAYNLIVLHQLPSFDFAVKPLLQQLKNRQIPTLFVLGEQSNIRAFNDQFAGINVQSNVRRSNDAQAVFNQDFNLFTLNDEAAGFLSSMPPLKTPFGKYRNANSATVFLHQKIGVVKTEQPLIVFNTSGKQKSGVVAGEGIWRWRLQDFQEHGNHKIFEEVIGKMVQFLSVKDDKSYFRVFSQNNFMENETILFEAELYNESYELINAPEVNLNITDVEGNIYPFKFSRTSTAYRLDAGMLGAGEYRYEATTSLGDKAMKETGVFTVNPVRIESIQTTADHQLLYALSSKHGGELLLPNQLSNIPQLLAARGDLKPVIYNQKELKDLINLKWVFFVLIAFLSLEWFLRKRSGAY